MIKPWEWYGVYRRVFGTEEGKLLLGDLAKRFRVFSNTYRMNDTHGTAFNEGQRSVILDIFKHLNVTDKEILTMKEEHERNTRTDEY